MIVMAFLFQKDIGWIIELFYDHHFEDSSMYPTVEDVMDCLKEKITSIWPDTEVDKLDPDELKVDLHVREKRNRKNSTIKSQVKIFQETNDESLLITG